FGAPSGLHTVRPAGFEGVLDGTNVDAALVTAHAPLAACLATAGLAAGTIAVATVFTTQDPVEELQRVRDLAADPARTDAPVIADWTAEPGESDPGRYETHSGSFDAPIFQT